MNFEVIWSRVTRVSAFVGGLSIMGYETLGDKGERPWLYAAAIGMMGLPIARAAEELISHFSPHGPTALPPGASMRERSFTNPTLQEEREEEGKL